MEQTMLEAMMSRKSVRSYTDQMVSDADIEKVLKAGQYAANGRGRMATKFVVVKNREIRDELSKMNADIMGTTSDPFYGAPVVLVVLADKNRPTAVYDGSLVMGNLMLAAHNEGVGSCWIHRAKEEFESEEGKEILRSLGIEGEYEGIGHCALGYTEGEYPEGHERKDNWVYYIK